MKWLPVNRLQRGMDRHRVVDFTGPWDGQIVATSVHAGHDIRADLQQVMILDEADRVREEDPFTDEIAAAVPSRAITHPSRFEVDLNRPRREAVYRAPEDAWGLTIWRDEVLPDDLFRASLQTWDTFYTALAERLDAVAERGPFVLLDVHSYNHRRPGPDQPAEAVADNPEVNLGTGSVDPSRFGGLVDRFARDLADPELGCGPVDVRENVKFEGRQLAWWVHDRYPRTGCVLALEFKKTFMDEWTGVPDRDAIACARTNLAATLPGLAGELAALS